MGIKVSQHSASIASGAVLFKNVSSLCGMNGMFKNSINPHALVGKGFKVYFIGSVSEQKHLPKISTVAHGLKLASPHRTLGLVGQSGKVTQAELHGEYFCLVLIAFISVVAVRRE